MTNQENPGWPDYFKLSLQAAKVLNSVYNDLGKIFPSNTTEIFQHLTDECFKERIAEVRFNTEQATLTCHYNSKGLCYGTYLFFDHDIDVNNYIEFISRNFAYSFSTNKWMVHNTFMSVQKVDEIIGFMFCCRNTSPRKEMKYYAFTSYVKL